MKTTGIFSIAILFFLVAIGLQEFNLLEKREFGPVDVQINISRLLGSIDLKLGNADFDIRNVQQEYSDEVVWLKLSNSTIVDWTSNAFIPDLRMLGRSGKWTLFKSPSVDYLGKIVSTDKDTERFAVIVILRRDYKIVNNYLQPTFNSLIFGTEEFQINNVESNESFPIFYNDEIIFFATHLRSVDAAQPDYIIAALLIISSSLFFWAVFLGFLNLVRAKKYGKALSFVILTISIYRFAILWAGFPSAYFFHPIFDPVYFASSFISPSMADMLINTFCLAIFSVSIFSYYTRLKIVRRISRIHFVNKFLLATFLFTCLLFSALLIWITYQTIYRNSTISLDITESLSFDVLRLMAFSSVVLVSASFFFLSHVFLQLIRLALSSWTIYLIAALLAIIIFAVINTYNNQEYAFVLISIVGYVLLLYTSNLYKKIARLNYLSFVYFFTAALCCSLLGTMALVYYEKKEKTDIQKKFANEFMLERDDLAEYLLNEARENIAKDLFIQSRMASPFLGKEAVRQKVRQVYLSRYFDKYNVRIMLFNANGYSYDQFVYERLRTMTNRIQQEGKRTSYSNIYYIGDAGGDVFKRYFTVVPIVRSGNTIGFIALDLSLKRIIPDNVYPELLVDTRFLQPYRDRDISYALVADDQVQYSAGDFNYRPELVNELLTKKSAYSTGVILNGYLHTAVDDEGFRIAIVSSRWNSYLKNTAGFSFLFLVHLVLILGVIIAIGFITVITKRRLNYSARIQLYLNIAFFLPLAIMSITVLSLMSTSFRDEQNADYIDKARTFGSRIQQLLEENIKDIEAEELQQQVASLAGISNLEINIYSTKGKLLASSQPQVFENQIFSDYINPKARIKLLEEGNQSIVIEERVGKLTYFNAYAVLRYGGTGEYAGILSIPFYDSGYLLERSRINVFANIVNIFTLLFFLFLFISFFTSKWLTFPLQFITQKLKRTTLTGQNQPLVWRAQDEIGLMVSEYNRMLENLEHSKARLARTQLEAAWREIAQQVAHEIKNPLTPMKLTIQHLQHTMDRGELDTDKSQRSLKTLLTQIDTLDGIATSFSTFAKMPRPESKRVDLVTLIRGVVELYRNQGFAEISYKVSQHQAWIMADEQLIGRILSNLILNGIQSVEEGNSIKVSVELGKRGSQYIVAVRDNGRGISEDMRSKIFIPRFTTKQSGSGIGLAIVKQGVAYFNGRVWFDTSLQKGTTFYISFPSV